MADNHLKNIALIGASGNIGSSILKHLLESNRFNITIVTRADSKSTFPSHPSITSVKKGSYTDPSFLSSAFSGQDAAIFALSFTATQDQTPLIEAAANAGVKWIIPNEYAGDGMNERMMDAVLLFRPKVEARKQIDELSKTHEGLKWIGVATNPWTELSLMVGLFGIQIPARKVVLYEGSGEFNTSTLEQAGKGIARLLSLPIKDEANPRASLEHYANNFVYISSFLTTQRALFEAALRATGTTESEWKLEQSSIQQRIDGAQEGLKEGNIWAIGDVSYANYMGSGRGGNYEEKAKADRQVLGLEEENLDEVMKGLVQSLEKP